MVFQNRFLRLIGVSFAISFCQDFVKPELYIHAKYRILIHLVSTGSGRRKRICLQREMNMLYALL